jgi:predicted MFS family arabinose efflux permease
MVGAPIALAFGVPTGTVLGSTAGWRTTFATISVLSLILMGWIRFGVPDIPPLVRSGDSSIWSVLKTPGIGPVMLVTAAWMFGQHVFYTYISPFLAEAGLRKRIDLVLLLFGVCALIGIWATGQFVESYLRVSVLASLTVFALAGIVLISIFTWGLSFGGASTLLNTAAADTAGDNADIVLAMVTTVWNLAIAAGSIAGGIMLAANGPQVVSLAMLAAALLALGVTWQARVHAFSGGVRKARADVSHPERGDQVKSWSTPASSLGAR